MSETATLADHLAVHGDAILAHWREATLAPGGAPEASWVPEGEFLDHVPELLDRLGERLRGRSAGVKSTGREHGRHRWRQGYDVGGLVRELGRLRATLARATADFARRHGWGLEPYESALGVVHEVIDEATAESVRQFQDDGRHESQRALAEVKARQRATEEAWVTAQVEKAKLRAVLRNLPAAVWVVDADGYVIGINDEAERIHGVDKSQVSGKLNVLRPGPDWRMLRPDGSACPDDRLPVVRALRGETVRQEELVLVVPAGPRTVAVNAAPLAEAPGQGSGAVVVMLDVTARKRAEEQLGRERDVSRTVTETVGEGLCTVDTAGRITFANPAALRLLGWDAAELLGRPLNETVRAIRGAGANGGGSGGPVTVAAALAPPESPIDRALRTGETVFGDEEFVRRDGSTFVAEFTASPIVSAGRIVGLVQAFHDVTGRKRLEAELAASEVRFRVIAEKSPVMIWRTDAAGRCDYVNQTYAEFRGRGFDRERDAAWSEGMHPEDRPRCLEAFRAALGRRETFEVSYRLRRHDGQYRWVSDRGVPLYAADGALLGYLGSCLDITPRIELEHALEQQRVMAEEASRHKTRLVSALSHDARTPLNAVVLAAELLEAHAGAEPDDEVRQCLRTIRHSVRNVLELLNDLLDLSKIDAGAMPVEASTFSLRSTLAECLSSVETQARQKGLEVRFEPGPAGRLAVETDRGKFKQIVSNLLSNALRYTERGHIRLSAGADADRVWVAVEDTGVGIAAEDQSRIFDEFAVLDHPRRHAAEGTGLGLSICRRLANLLKGEITLVSRPGEGSTFTLVLPGSVVRDGAAAPVADTTLPTPTDGRAQGGDRGTVLVVEDHLDSRQTLARVLRRMGFRVIEAGNGRDALNLARGTPDLVAVLMDVVMPVMDGVEATRLLRADPALRNLTIFALTGDVSPVNQRRIAEAGVDGFLEKPVTWDALRDALAPAPADPTG